MICIGNPPETYKNPPLHLLVLEEEENLIQLSNEVSRIFFEYNTLEQMLQDAVNNGRNIQYLVDLMAPYFNGNELIVNNSDFRFVGISNKTERVMEVSGYAQPDSNGMLIPEIVEFFKNDIIFVKIRDLTEPFIYEPSIFVCRLMCFNVFYHGEFACRVMVSEDRNAFLGYEGGLIRFFASFIQLVFDLTEDNAAIRPRDHLTDMFVDLLHGESVKSWQLENSMSQRGWRMTGPYLCASIMLSDRDYYIRTIPYYCIQFNKYFRGCCSFEYERSIVCIVNLEYYDNSPDAFMSAYLNTFRDGYFRVGYSRVFFDILDLSYHYMQASIAIRIGVEQFPSQWYHKFSDIVFYYMRSKLTEELDGRFLCAPEILTLSRYDRENQGDYVHTLKQYLGNQLNAAKTAQDLFIHRATMKYRLKRIETLTGIDFQDSEKILYLNLSFKFFTDTQEQQKENAADPLVPTRPGKS
ncbi:MAG: helix-turn-helix domain-containing protein [Oscillospiraceae bacterium]|nr:helix-turn-helix domain-containing protein [Oscillospiraceae bacterium]